jgi:cytochrome c2
MSSSGARRGTSRTVVASVVATAFVLLAAQGAHAQDLKYFRTDTPQFIASAKLGKQMVQAYQCALCHATKEGQPLTSDIIAPNLILAKKRLRPAWILQWLIDPQKLQPGTKMPNFFSFNEDDDYKPIYGDADAHVQYKIIVALRDYLMVLGTDADKGLDQDASVEN